MSQEGRRGFWRFLRFIRSFVPLLFKVQVPVAKQKDVALRQYLIFFLVTAILRALVPFSEDSLP